MTGVKKGELTSMLIVILTIATSLIVFWFILMFRAIRDDWIVAAYNKVYENTAAIVRLRMKNDARRKKLSGYRGLASVGLRLLRGGDRKKEINRLGHINECLKKGDLTKVNVFVVPGYVLQREFEAIGRGDIHKAIMTMSYELYGKGRATYKTIHLLAKLLSYPIIGVAGVLTLGALLMGAGSTTAGVAILGIGTVLVLVMTYAIYDELRDKVKKRREAISRQFPNVVSKLALLVTSGMIMDRAWKETAYSQESDLYQEMRKTADELDNLVSPESAYSNFINRCNTKETAKLASAIMQNLSKGNAEIGRLLKDMAREAWQERRHMAKRDAEKANSKLMIPTMLLLLAILVLLMVPVAMNFSGI